ncbi:MAG: DUF493 family protein [Burkholderiaceae bacterium]|nr:DUF493 family protein [Burkholderiaceae bacterium]
MSQIPPPLARIDTLLTYPMPFPIKVMGAKSDALVAAVAALAQQFDPSFDRASIRLRASRTGKYLGITLTITATSRTQLDGLYRALTSHPLVQVVL